MIQFPWLAGIFLGRLQLVACPLALFAVLPDQAGIEIAFRWQLAQPDKLHNNRHTRYSTAQFDVGKIARVNPHPFRQFPAGHSYDLPCLLHVCPKIFKTGTVFYIRNIISPSYILLFIECAGNDLICVLVSFYNSVITIWRGQQVLSKNWFLKAN